MNGNVEELTMLGDWAAELQINSGRLQRPKVHLRPNHPKLDFDSPLSLYLHSLCFIHGILPGDMVADISLEPSSKMAVSGDN